MKDCAKREAVIFIGKTAGPVWTRWSREKSLSPVDNQTTVPRLSGV
jgi:hypothetical protein